MTAKIIVIVFISLCLEVGVLLTLLPWVSPRLGFVDWGDNYLLVYAASKTNLPILRTAIASGWVRGAVTALGILNIAIAFWEIAHFSSAVRAIEGKTETNQNASVQQQAAPLSNHAGRDERQ
ncbi:MAG TPA: hypothetical protein VGB02_16515 [Pyrinomonadaceae bacterium]|jgi:hypothetical protein